MMLGSITSTTDFNCTTNHNAKQYYILQNVITFHRQSFYSIAGKLDKVGNLYVTDPLQICVLINNEVLKHALSKNN